MVTEGNSAAGRREDSLDIDHLAQLANLPLSEEEKTELEGACSQVLEAFRLEDVEEDIGADQEGRWIEDEVHPWPAEEIEAILEAFPRREGRRLQR